MIPDPRAVRGEAGPDLLDGLRRAKAVQHDVGPGLHEAGGDAQPNTAGGAGDDGRPTLQRFVHVSASEARYAHTSRDSQITLVITPCAIAPAPGRAESSQCGSRLLCRGG